MSKRNGFDGKWLFSILSVSVGFYLGTVLIRIIPEFYYWLTLTLFALVFCGLCSKLYDKLDELK